jgi:hypothetical protein
MAGGGGGGAPSSTDIFQARLNTALGGVSNTLTLLPYKGNKILIGGVNTAIPSGGLTVLVGANLITALGADSGVAGAANTLYYVYVSNSKSPFAPNSIRLSNNPPSLVNGVKYLGVAANALNWRFAGWVRLNATPNFESSLTSRTIVNYYNRLALSMYVNPGYVNDNAATTYLINTTTYSTLAAFVGSGISKLTFISNGEDDVDYDANYVILAAATILTLAAIGEDSVTQAAVQAMTQMVGIASNNSISLGRKVTFTEGVHTLDMLAAAQGGNSNFYADGGRAGGDPVDAPATELSATVYG